MHKKSSENKSKSPKKIASEDRRWYELNLPQALFVAILLAGIVTSVSTMIYMGSDERKFDINRPGGKYNPPQLTISDDSAMDTSSPIDVGTLKEVSGMIDEQLGKLKPYSSYNDVALDDKNLGFK